MSRAERRITVVAVVLPFAGFCLALWLLWGGLVTLRDLCILAAMYTLAGFGITIGFHRLLSHRSFDAPALGTSGTFAVLGSTAAQGAVIHWVAHHRKHHAFADEEGDPHSPTPPGAAGMAGRRPRNVARAHRMDVRRTTNTPQRGGTRRISAPTRRSVSSIACSSDGFCSDSRSRSSPV